MCFVKMIFLLLVYFVLSPLFHLYGAETKVLTRPKIPLVVKFAVVNNNEHKLC
jgi:hypothetical protein